MLICLITTSDYVCIVESHMCISYVCLCVFLKFAYVVYFVSCELDAIRLTGFQTGSGQTGFSQKGNISFRFAIICFECQGVAAFCDML